jgi:tetratricopeptide (TPR) repeat protein
VGQLDTRLSLARRPYEIGAIAAILLLFAVGSHRYSKIFMSQETLWTYTIHRFPDGWPAHNNLGNAYLDSNRLAEAETQYKEALRLNPGYPEAHNNLGIVLARIGKVPEALEQFQDALQLCPDLESAQRNLAQAQTFQQTRPPARPHP